MILPIVTERLILRAWRPEDRAPLAAINADPVVMEHFPTPLTPAETDEMLARWERSLKETGMTFFAAEEQATGRMIGALGLRRVRENNPLYPDVEIGWRLAADVWGRGLATEGARAVIRLAFGEHDLPRIVAYTTPKNGASRRVMEKVGLHRAADRDFDHPDLPADHAMRRHVVYAREREAWLASPIAALST